MAQQARQEPEDHSHKQRGRPRSEAAHYAVLDAATALLEEQGCTYEELTVERIATTAGVGKQTIYRWWRNKAAVVLEAVLTGRLKLDFADLPNTGDLRADLTTWIHDGSAEEDVEDGIAMARSLMAALVTSGEETYALLESSTLWENMNLTQRLHAEAEAGHLKPGVDPEAAAGAIMAPLIMQLITVGKPESHWCQAQLDVVLDGILPSAHM